MSVRTIARDDVTNARRSYVVAGTVAVFTVLVGLVFAGDSAVHADAYRGFWDVSALVAWFFPLFVAALTYLAIAGDRDRGSIKYALGLPNSRIEYFSGKLLSRSAVAVATILASMALGFAVSVTAFTGGADPLRFLTFTAVSVLYALAITATFIAISATVASRTRAMLGVVGAYFLLVVFFSMPVPVLNVQTVLDTITSTIGVTLSETTIDAIRTLSPANAYLQTTEFAYRGVLDEYEAFQTFTQQPNKLVYSPWFGVVGLGGWTLLAPVVGFLQFRDSELG